MKYRSKIQKSLPHSTTQHKRHFFTPSSQSLQRLSPLDKMVASHNLHGLTKLIVVQLLLGISMQMKWFIKSEYLYFDNMQKYFGQTFFTVMKTEDHSSKVTFGSLFIWGSYEMAATQVVHLVHAKQIFYRQNFRTPLRPLPRPLANENWQRQLRGHEC